MGYWDSIQPLLFQPLHILTVMKRSCNIKIQSKLVLWIFQILLYSKGQAVFCEFRHSVWNGWSSKGWMLSHSPLFVGWIYWHSLVVHSRIITIGENTKAINVMRDSCLCKVKFPITYTEYTYSHLMGYRVSILVVCMY